MPATKITKEYPRGVWDQLDKPLVYLAPMSGITNKAYRQIVKKFHSDLVFPEFVSIDGMHYDSPRSWELLDFDETERPIIAQVFGSRPEFFKEAAQKIVKLGYDGLDINFGCPVPKVAKNGGGCALLADLDHSRRVIEAALEGVDGKIPVSVKTRVSYKDTHVADFAEKIADLPLAAICVHGRSFEKKYIGDSDLEWTKRVKERVPFYVLSSGNANTPEEAKATLDQTGCDGVALARGTFGAPWLGKQIKDYLETGTYHIPDQVERLDVMMEHARLTTKMNSSRPFVEIRKVLAWYIKGIPNAASYRKQLVQVDKFEDVERIVDEMRIDLGSKDI